MEVVRIRRAESGDVTAIAEVHRLSRASYYGLPPDPPGSRDQMWTELLGQARRVTHVAETAGPSPVTLGFVSTTPGDGALELTGLYVDPERFGEGVGSALYDAFAAQLVADQHGVLEVWAGNDRAIGFYQRRGWTATDSSRPGPLGRDYVSHVLAGSGRRRRGG